MIALLARLARADVISVPADVDSIGDALGEAKAGDVIEVAPGEYTEQLVISEAIAIVGTGGSAATRITGLGSEDVFTVPTDGVTIRGFTIDPVGRAAVAAQGDVELTDLRIEQFGTFPDQDDNYGGVEAFGNQLTLRDVTFDGEQTAAGTAVVASRADVVLERVMVIGVEPIGALGVIDLDGGTLSATDVTILSSTGSSGIRTLDTPTTLVRVLIACSTFGGAAVSVDGGPIDVGALQVSETTASELLRISVPATAKSDFADVHHTTLVAASDATTLLYVVAKSVSLRSSILVGHPLPIVLDDLSSGIDAHHDLFDPNVALPPDVLVDAVLGDPVLVADGRECQSALALQVGSPAIDAGDPADLDRNGTRSDIGATGGPDGFVVDVDNDFAGSDVDCDDFDAAVFPGAADPPGDGIDQDCSGSDIVDGDGDGSPAGEDCDDADPGSFPGADEVWYDGVDQDCSGGPDTDADGDGFDGEEVGGLDCDDEDPAVRPDAEEDLAPVDLDCDGHGDPTGRFGPAGCSVGGSGGGLLIPVLFLLRRRCNSRRHPA